MRKERVTLFPFSLFPFVPPSWRRDRIVEEMNPKRSGYFLGEWGSNNG